MESTQQQPQQQPSKQQLARDYMGRRRVANTPPPEQAEVRRQMGWGLSGASVQECLR